MRGGKVVGRLCVTLVAVLASWQCGGSPAAPPPPVPQLTLVCPSLVEARSEDGQPVPVSFALPTFAGGQPPVNLTCSVGPGTALGVGTTAVTCTAVDGRGITAQCGFTVRVAGPARLLGTTFVAFGDSITTGKLPPGGSIVESEFAYSFPLERLLRERYRLQNPVVSNEGVSAEKTYEGGRARLPAVLLAHRADALLLMEGTNDVLDESGIDAGIEALRDMIRSARGSNVAVFVATLPPQRASGSRSVSAERITRFNELLRQLAASEGVVLVDVHAAMKDDVATLISSDDLHPSPRGLEVIAEAFFDAIRTHFEEQPASAFVRVP